MRKSDYTLALLLVGLVIISGCIGGEKITERIKEEAGSVIESYTESQGESTTEPPPETFTETQAPAIWNSPWDAYHPVIIDGEQYLIVYIKYYLRVRTEEGGEVYEYEVEKKRGKVKIHVYGTQINMETGEKQKVDIGEFEVYEYYGKITPIKGEEMENPLEFKVWVKKRTKDSDTFFLLPSLDFITLYGAVYTGGGDVIGISITYGDQKFIFYNPAAVGDMSSMAYQEGDIGMISNIPDVGNIYTTWHGFYTFGVWEALAGEDLYKAKKGSWGVIGYMFNYEINPDGTITLGGKSFRVSSVKWTYTFGNAQGQGEATLTVALPVPIESKGVFIGEGMNIFTHIKIEDIGFEKI